MRRNGGSRRERERIKELAENNRAQLADRHE
jgi:hypothetical protein